MAGLDPVTFGLSLPNRAVLFGLPTESLLKAARLADASGLFDSVWVGDNFLSKPRLEAIVFLSGLATTTKLRLGTICLATFPMRHPLPLALQWASLDVLSGGRTILAVCNGGSALERPLHALELQTMGIRSADRAARVEEGIEILRALWGEAPTTYRGKFYSFEGVEALPKPIQDRIPIVIAVNPGLAPKPEVEEKMLRRVARLGDGWQTDSVPSHLFRERWARIREYASEYGRSDSVSHSSYHLMVHIKEDVSKARAEAVQFLARYYGEGAIGEEFMASWLVAGPPSAVIDKIGELLEAGVTTPVLRFTSADQEGQVQRCIEEVLPAFSNQKIAV